MEKSLKYPEPRFKKNLMTNLIRNSTLSDGDTIKICQIFLKRAPGIFHEELVTYGNINDKSKLLIF